MVKARRRTPPPGRKSAGAASRRVVVEFPEPLFRRAEQAAVELATDRSKLVRSAVERYLEVLRQRRLEAELAEGYAANAVLNREIAEEFAGLEEEGL